METPGQALEISKHRYHAEHHQELWEGEEATTPAATTPPLPKSAEPSLPKSTVTVASRGVAADTRPLRLSAMPVILSGDELQLESRGVAADTRLGLSAMDGLMLMSSSESDESADERDEERVSTSRAGGGRRQLVARLAGVEAHCRQMERRMDAGFGQLNSQLTRLVEALGSTQAAQ
jgi:hypothetical protein